MQRTLPFSHYTSVSSSGSDSQITLATAIPGYKIVLRGIQFTCLPASSVSGPGIAGPSNFLLMTPAGATSGKFNYYFLPSTTDMQSLQFDYAEGTVETSWFRPGSLTAPMDLTFDFSSTGSDDLTLQVNYWGSYYPYED